ncbi:MAG TPA: hypothetical protein VFI30_04790, partial [Nocardioidaceae bacterium]|nr:hypothetical protein [Nocardioidaceae bacterium]
MFEPEDTHRQSHRPRERQAPASTLGPEHRPPSAAGVSGWAGSLATLDGSAGPAEAIELVGALEALKSAAAAAQARLTAELARRAAADAAAAAPAGLDGPSRRRLVAAARRDVGAQVALARHDSPARGDRHLGLATALVEEMPAALAALAAGRLSEWRATLLVRETACLSAADRARVDAELAGRCDGRGDRAVAAAARGAAYRLDPAAVVARARHAQGERRVGIRPAPDTMAYLT